MKACHSSSVIVAASNGRSMPAFATTMSRPPWRSIVADIAAPSSSSDVTSHGRNVTGRGPSDAAASTSRPTASSTSQNVTDAPARRRRSTQARPMP
jgi:hypothetical protein